MPLFTYRAVDETGQEFDGSMAESSARRVAAILSERGLQVSEVRPFTIRRGLLPTRKRLTWEDLDLLNEQLLAITRSGLPLAPSIAALAKDIRNPRLRPILEDVHTRLDQGATLEQALGRHADRFSPIYLSIVRAGERSGNLSGVLSNLTDYSSKMLEAKSRVQEAIAYPCVVVAVAFAVLVLLLLKVVPAYAEAFESFGMALPWMTQASLNASSVVRANFMPISVVVTAMAAGLSLMASSILHNYSLGRRLDWLKLHLWVFGSLCFSSAMARFSRSLGLLLASRVPPVESLHLAAATMGNAVLRDAVAEAAEDVNGGGRLSDALESTGRFQHTFCWLLATAEERGDVDEALLTLAEGYERSVARLGGTVLALLAPATIVFLATVIGSVVLSMYLPLFTLADAIGGF
ncbi:MAG: type II secretion system F family protein [Candidatus Hydrogenedentes bacterium]|nr:type II secretion system F family protein [Candidatus Hydrogenedentota bacterium]